MPSLASYTYVRATPCVQPGPSLERALAARGRDDPPGPAAPRPVSLVREREWDITTEATMHVVSSAARDAGEWTVSCRLTDASAAPQILLVSVRYASRSTPEAADPSQQVDFTCAPDDLPGLVAALEGAMRQLAAARGRPW